MYTYRLLNHETVQPLLRLVAPLYHAALVSDGELMLAIGAFYFWQPVGLLVAGLRDDAKYAQILSLRVVEAHRQKGVGARLLTEAESHLRERGCQQVDLGYLTEYGMSEAVERMLERNGWPAPRTVNVMCRSNPDRYIESPLYELEIPLAEGYELFALADMTQEDRKAIQQRQDETPGGWYSESVSPFTNETQIEPVNSVGMRYQGEIIGWMLTHRLSPQDISYTTLFVDRKHKGHSLGMALVAEATRRQFAHNIAQGEAWTTHFRLFADSKWTKMLLDFAGPAFTVQEYRVSSKMLQDETAEPILTLLSELPDHFLR